MGFSTVGTADTNSFECNGKRTEADNAGERRMNPQMRLTVGTEQRMAVN